jgi:hypothetical protein
MQENARRDPRGTPLPAMHAAQHPAAAIVRIPGRVVRSGPSSPRVPARTTRRRRRARGASEVTVRVASKRVPLASNRTVRARHRAPRPHAATAPALAERHAAVDFDVPVRQLPEIIGRVMHAEATRRNATPRALRRSRFVVGGEMREAHADVPAAAVRVAPREASVGNPQPAADTIVRGRCEHACVGPLANSTRRSPATRDHRRSASSRDSDSRTRRRRCRTPARTHRTRTAPTTRRARIDVVRASGPWRHAAPRAPQWRGVSCVREPAAAGTSRARAREGGTGVDRHGSRRRGA